MRRVSLRGVRRVLWHMTEWMTVLGQDNIILGVGKNAFKIYRNIWL
jgi:hypothetical protein